MSRDQVWLSPELAARVVNVSHWQIFPDHITLIAGLDLHSHSMQWCLPGHVPWPSIDLDSWNSLSPLGTVLDFQQRPVGGPVGACGFEPGSDFDANSSTEGFRAWSSRFEDAAATCMTRINRNYFGRGKLTRLQRRRQRPPVVKSSRPGEVTQVSGFLNRSISRWFKQLRRLQSYLHAVRSPRVVNNFLSRASFWRNIISAHGFVGGFCSWWSSRPVRLQGSPAVFPLSPPHRALAEQLFEDFSHNYKRFER